MKPKKLEDFNKENIYQVPDGYFGKLSLKIQQKVSSHEQQPIRIFSPRLLRIGLPSFAVLSISLILWFNISSEYNELQDKVVHHELLSEFSQEEVDSYILTEDISHIELTEAARNNNLEFTEKELSTTAIEEEILELDIDLIDVQTYL